MRKRDRLRRIFSVLTALILLVVCVPYADCAHEETLTVSTFDDLACVDACPPLRPIRVVRETVDEASYMMDAAMDELDSLVQYATGKDPTADKPIEAEGQNTKRNVATTLIDFARQTRTVSPFYFQLLPYSDQKNVYELCAFYTPLFCGEEQVVHTGLLHDYNTQTIYRTDGTGILGIGYDFNFAFDTFYAADDPWQRNFGFCPLYDFLAFLIGDVCETIRVPFRYDGKDWMIQIWKGVYSGNMLGAEIGIYNKPTDRTTQFYDCAADPDRAEMSFAVYLGDEKIVESEQKTAWWQTAFTYHALAKPSDLTLCGKLTLKDAAMAKAFEASLTAQNSSVQIHRNGREVTFTW